MAEFIDEKLIFRTLEDNERPDKKHVEEIIQKSLTRKGLSIEETAVLMQADDPELIEQMFDAARQIKFGIYGKRVVLFAPLYVTNECANNCLYCAFRKDNVGLIRKTLTMDEVKQEVGILEEMGHKRLLLVYGEMHGIKYLEDTIEAAYSVKVEKGEIRRINVNAAPLSVEDFKALKATGIGTYQCFQETYHLETYKKMHPTGKKADYPWRLYALHRAQEAGIDDVSVGVLYGLFDWKFETLALLQHCQHLDNEFGVGPHTISFPRIEPALNSDVAVQPPYPVSDDDFKKLVAIIRMAVPYTGMILTTRETAELRREVLDLGVSQMSAGSRTNPGGYKEAREHAPDTEQFTLGDTRPLDEVIKDLAQNNGYVPSFCTACYRLGRTGVDFMDLAKPGLIKNFCLPNALLTFKEYLEDYATEETKKIGIDLIEKQLDDIPVEKRKAEAIERLKKVENGERDLYF
ncbi:MAG TPA: [FeFe] hydrogenase H-cluster radical SAM maturase HydG [bacterium]|nr:[FeFe] hydrogenase H-cluster radical SAM maturase HydG [bacterium]